MKRRHAILVSLAVQILLTSAALLVLQTPTDRPNPKAENGEMPPLRGLTPEQLERLKTGGPTNLATYKAAIARGRAEADEELRSNRARIWTWGMTVMTTDWETGLHASGFGCSIDDEILGRVDGHNARIAEYIREHGLPKYSLKPWEKELRDPDGYFDAQSRIEKPIRLILGGPEVKSPDGRFSVKLVRRTHEIPEWVLDEGPPKIPDPGRKEKMVKVDSTFLLVNGNEDEEARIWMFQEELELVWGPKDSWFAVIRGKSPKTSELIIEAIDLREPRRLYKF